MISEIVQGNLTEHLVFGPLVLAVDHISGAAGKVLTVTISKNGGAFAPPAGAITEVGNGYYRIAANPTDADTAGTLVIHATASDCDPFDDELDVIGVGQQPSYLAPISTITVADLLRVMEVIDNELETASGEVDESTCISALTEAQHYFETVAASYANVLQTVVTVATVNAVEGTTWPSYLLRLDGLWYLDANGNPVRKLKRIEEVGGHVPSLPWPFQITLSSIGQGAPFGYYANMQQFYWLARPDTAYTLRVYGMVEQAEFVSRASAFNYPSRCKLAFAQFATKLVDMGVEDDTLELDKLAGQIFRPLIKQLRKFDRSEPQSRHYQEFHST